MCMQDCFVLKSGQQVEVDITQGFLQYRTEGKCFPDVSVPVEMVLAVEVRTLDSTTKTTVHFAKETDSRKLRVETLDIFGEEETCRDLASRLQKIIDGADRPRHLLVIVNPNSGKKQAQKIFKRKVKPFFQLCGIATTLIVTSRAKQAQELLQTIELETFDGVVTVGGDGLYCECLSGLTMRAQKDAGIDYHKEDADHVPSPIPIGIIPSGSGNYAAQYLHGTTDVLTSAIHIALGGRVAANAVSLHSGGRLAFYSGLLIGFGLIGDMMNDCEKFRWMGPSRYHVIPVGTVLRRRMVDVEVEYQTHPEGDWRKSEGMMYGVDTYVITLKDKGDSMVPCFGDDALSVHMTRKCSFRKHVQHLKKIQDHQAGAYDYDFVQHERVQAFRVRLPRSPVLTLEDGSQQLQDKLYINCDGEVMQLSEPEFLCRLHRNAVTLFGRSD